VRFPLDRIGSPLLKAKPLSDPILDSRFVCQRLDRRTLRKIAMKQIVLHIFEAPKRGSL
jgi:hypothetical protein